MAACQNFNQQSLNNNNLFHIPHQEDEDDRNAFKAFQPPVSSTIKRFYVSSIMAMQFDVEIVVKFRLYTHVAMSLTTLCIEFFGGTQTRIYFDRASN